jgi:hypothetical protein
MSHAIPAHASFFCERSEEGIMIGMQAMEDISRDRQESRHPLWSTRHIPTMQDDLQQHPGLSAD